MRRSTRTFLFLFFAGLFLILTPMLWGYSQGYRLDWQEWKVLKTGALFLEPRPAPVEFFLNGKLKKRSSFVFQNIFAGNLIPKEHQIEVRKDGYHSWEKRLVVFPKLVTEARNIYLFPKILGETQPIGIKVKDAYASGTTKYLVFVEDNIIPRLTLYSTQTQQQVLTFDAPDEFRGYEAGDIEWNKGEKSFLFSLERSGTKKWVAVSLKNGGFTSVDISSEILSQELFPKYTKSIYKPEIHQVQWDPQETMRIYFIASGDKNDRLLFSYNIETKKISQALAHDVLTYIPSTGSKIVYVSSALGTINYVALDTGEISQGSFSPLFAARSSKRVLFLKNTPEPYAALVADDRLYLFNKNTLALKQLSSGVRSATISSDGKKILILADYGLAVYWLADIKIQPFRDAGDFGIIKNADVNYEIQAAIWFWENNEYVILSSSQNNIEAIELDERDKRNVIALWQTGASKLFYEPQSKMLYVYSGEDVYALPLK